MTRHYIRLGFWRLIGALQGIIEVRFRSPRKKSILLIPCKIRRLFVSMEDPEALVRDLITRADRAA